MTASEVLEGMLEGGVVLDDQEGILICREINLESPREVETL